jgi:hypothetical protein
MSTRVYLSYAPADAAFAARLRDDLRAAGEDVEESRPELDTYDLSTSDGMTRVNDALAQREIEIIVLSPSSLASPRVNRELYVAAGRASTGAMRQPVLVTEQAVASESLPALWGRYPIYDTSGDYAATSAYIVKVVDGTADDKPRGLGAIVDGKGFSPQAIWARVGVRGALVVVSALVLLLSFGMPWFSVGIACTDQDCSLGTASVAPGPNNVDGYYLAADKRVNVSTGTAPLLNAGVKIQNGYAENNGIFDPHLPQSVTDGTQTVVLNDQLTFTTTPTLSFGFAALSLFLPFALIMLIMPLLVSVVGLKPIFAKVLMVLPILVMLALLVVFIVAAPEAFHSSELIHFAPGPGGGAWLAFLFTVIAASAALSISTKPATQKVS